MSAPEITPSSLASVPGRLLAALVSLAGILVLAFVALYTVSSVADRHTLLEAVKGAWPTLVVGAPGLLGLLFAGSAHSFSKQAAHNTNGALTERMTTIVANELDRRGLIAPSEEADALARTPASSGEGAGAAVPAAPSPVTAPAPAVDATSPAVDASSAPSVAG